MTDDFALEALIRNLIHLTMRNASVIGQQPAASLQKF